MLLNALSHLFTIIQQPNAEVIHIEELEGCLFGAGDGTESGVLPSKKHPKCNGRLTAAE